MSEAIKTVAFKTRLVLEHSVGPTQDLGEHFNEMRLFRHDSGDTGCIIWNYGRKAADEDETVIGLIFEGSKVVDYDGVFELPVQARSLLNDADFDLTEIGYDAEGEETGETAADYYRGLCEE
jgi:hypothetical protein